MAETVPVSPELVSAVRTAVDTAVSAALEEERRTVVQAERSAAAARAADEVDRDILAQRLKRVKLAAAAAVAVVTAVASGVAWVYARGQQAQAATDHERQQDTRIGTTKAALDKHVESATEADAAQTNKIRHLGALQIEQGNDQRRILLESAPKRVRDELGAKPPKLLEAEGRVLRD